MLLTMELRDRGGLHLYATREVTEADTIPVIEWRKRFFLRGSSVYGVKGIVRYHEIPVPRSYVDSELTIKS